MADIEVSNGQHAPGAPGNEPRWLAAPKARATGARPELPESTGYRLKRKLLGPPLVSDELHGERLGKSIALAVLSSDVMSSCAYGTESILRILVPAVGVAAFSLVTPATGLLLLVLGVVCLCYRQVVKTFIHDDRLMYRICSVPDREQPFVHGVGGVAGT